YSFSALFSLALDELEGLIVSVVSPGSALLPPPLQATRLSAAAAATTARPDLRTAANRRRPHRAEVLSALIGSLTNSIPFVCIGQHLLAVVSRSSRVPLPIRRPTLLAANGAIAGPRWTTMVPRSSTTTDSR